MRHYLLAGPVATLALGMHVTPAPAVLIAAAGLTDGAMARLIGTAPRAVAVSTVTVAADQYGGSTTGAQITSSSKVHWQSRPMGGSTATSAS